MQPIYIVVGNPNNDLKKEYFFIEMIKPLYCVLKDKYEIKMIMKCIDVDPNDETLHIGIFNLVDKMPKNYIMYNIEPPENRDEIYNKKLNNAKAILNYCEEIGFPKDSINYYKNITFPSVLYHPIIENLFNIDKNLYKEEIDVLFYGSMNERRINLVKYIKSAGINIYCPNRPLSNDYPHNVFGKEKDILIEKSKIIVLSLYYEKDIEFPRAVYCLSKKKCIIADSWGDNYKLSEYFDNIFPVVETKKICETIKYYLENENERKIIGQNGYEYVKNKYNIENYIDNIINKF